MELLTRHQRQRIKDLVDLHHKALIVEILGDEAVPPDTLKLLKATGMYRKGSDRTIKRSFQFGQHAVLNEKVVSMSNKEFRRYLQEEGSVLSAQERGIVDFLRRSLKENIETLANTMNTRVGRVVLEADAKLQRSLSRRHRKNVFFEVERRKAMAEVAKGLVVTTEQQLGSAMRTTVTETNNAYQEGRAIEIIKKSGSNDPDVFKRPRHDACDACVFTYLESDGVTPKVFKLSELVANGSNVGKSRSERQAVVGSFHPNCSCPLQWLAPGFGFEHGKMVYVGLGKSA